MSKKRQLYTNLIERQRKRKKIFPEQNLINEAISYQQERITSINTVSTGWIYRGGGGKLSQLLQRENKK